MDLQSSQRSCCLSVETNQTYMCIIKVKMHLFTVDLPQNILVLFFYACDVD